MVDGAELARLIAASRVIDLSVTTGTELPCSPPEGQPPA
jgi:kynurenine formamidase